MTQPPHPGPWGTPPPQQPTNRPGYPGPQPRPLQSPWNPQQPWSTPPPPKKPSPLKWILGAIAVIAVIAVTAVVALSFAGGKDSNGKDGGSSSTSGTTSDFASANDNGPISVITEADPTCAPWNPVNNIVAQTQTDRNWEQRDPSIPASAWTAEMRASYNAVADALRTAADQTVPLVKLTPHRVMRELYEQYIAYTRLFIDHVASYTPDDNYPLAAATTIGSVITSICSAISYGSAAARGPVVPKAAAPRTTAPLGDPSNPEKFMTTADAQCGGWNRAADELTSNPVFTAWLKTDSNIPASRWSPQEKASNDAIKPVISRAIDAYEELAAASSNPIFMDFAILGAQYGRAFIQGLPTYTGADMHLYLVFLRAPGIIQSACRSLGVK